MSAAPVVTSYPPSYTNYGWHCPTCDARANGWSTRSWAQTGADVHAKTHQETTTMTEQPQTLEQRLTPLAARLAGLQEARTLLTEQETAVKAQIRDLVQNDPGTYAAGPLTIGVQPNRRFDPEVTLCHLTIQESADCHRLTLDPALVKRHLTPDQLDEAMIAVGDVKVSLK